jgi:hypothetical protein
LGIILKELFNEELGLGCLYNTKALLYNFKIQKSHI